MARPVLLQETALGQDLALGDYLAASEWAADFQVVSVRVLDTARDTETELEWGPGELDQAAPARLPLAWGKGVSQDITPSWSL